MQWSQTKKTLNETKSLSKNKSVIASGVRPDQNYSRAHAAHA